jgi:prolipoprotein diacylglyceryltransferase
LPRHPVQLYESFSYLISFFILYYVYWYTSKRNKPGYVFGLFMVLIWGIRFIMEYYKDSQGGFEKSFGYVLSTGQLLSIPFVLIGLFYLLRPTPAVKEVA